MKYNKIIYDIRESLSQYQDDTNISDEYISYLIGVYRAEILKNELNNFQRVTSHINTQSFVIPLEEVSAYDCPLDVNCNTIIRSKYVIPNPIKTHLGYALTSVRPIDKFAKPFSVISEERLPYLKDSKYDRIYYFLGSDSYLYIVSKNDVHKLIKMITVSGVFADPLELESYAGCPDSNGNSVKKCYDILESEYPMTEDQIRIVVDMIVNKLANKLRVTEDNVNNSNDK